MTSSSPQTSQPARLEYLDSLRGIGALVVAWSHFANAFPIYLTWTDHVFNGKAAVSMFFVLSGYVLSIKHFQSERLELDLPRYLVARILRLWIPFAGAVAVAVPLQRLFPHFVHTVPFHWSGMADIWAEVQTPGMIMEQLDPRKLFSRVLVAPSWTLRSELTMSMLLPAYVVLARYRLELFLFFLYLTFVNSIGGYWILSFALGVLLAKCLPTVRGLSNRPLRVAALVIYIATYAIDWPRFLPISDDVHYMIWGVLSVMLIAVMLTSAWLQKIAGHAVPAYLGKISFSVYLLHWPLLCAFGPWVLHGLNAIGIIGPPTWWIGLALWTLLVIGVSSLFYPTVEVASISWGKKAGLWASRLVDWMVNFVYARLGLKSDPIPRG